MRSIFVTIVACAAGIAGSHAAPQEAWNRIQTAFECPQQFSNNFGGYRSPLMFSNGTAAATPAEWRRRRQEIVSYWTNLLGAWPPLLTTARIEVLGTTNRVDFLEQPVNVDIAAGTRTRGILLTPQGKGPFPAVLVPFYEPETSVGRGKPARDFALQLTKRGFVTLSIGSPGGDARRPDTSGAMCQPLHFLGYIAANCHTALSKLSTVDPKRIGVVGHSYGGKWAMFASCFYEQFACAAWSDPGIVFDESRPSVNYWEPWYLGDVPGNKRSPGVIREESPRTGPYKVLLEQKRDLHEVHALMAPRPFLVSGGSEDPPERWLALNHSVAVNKVLGETNRVAMTNRATHDPTQESNEALCSFFEFFLK